MNKQHIDERGHHLMPNIEIIRTMPAVNSPFFIFNIVKMFMAEMNTEPRKI